ncbi:MAG: hypothetical protein HY906_00760 [Deltaproteobacteria bacterium]|nr:hypothetical protein [Deltaproteobacteria bacterium]
MSSKMVIDRERSARFVAWAAETHAPSVAVKVAALLREELRPGEQAPDGALLVRLFGRCLKRSMAALSAADVAHEAELGDDADPRRRRDTAAGAVYGLLTTVRSAVSAVYGGDATALVGFAGPTPTDPTTVKALAAEVARNLPRLKDQPVQQDGLTFDVAKFEAQLKSTVAPLERALDDVARETREAEATLVEKQRRLAEHDGRFRSVAAVLEAVFALAGEHELAERVRPSRSRPGQTATEPPSLPPEPGPID